MRRTLTDGGLDPSFVSVGLATPALSDFCLGTGMRRVVVVEVGRPRGTPVTPATYGIGGNAFSPTGGAAVAAADFDGGTAGTPTVVYYAFDGGSIILTRVDDTGITGSFTASMMLQDGGAASTLSGTFEAPTIICN